MEPIRFLTPADSSITSLDLKELAGESWKRQSEYTFWTGAGGQLGIQHCRLPNDVFYRAHTLSEYTVFVCLEGGLIKTEAAGTCAIGPGEMMVANAGREHALHYLNQPATLNEIVGLTFDAKILSALAADFGLPAPGEGKYPAFIGRLVQDVANDCALDIARELRRRVTGHKLAVEILALRLLVEILRAWPRDQVQMVAADLVPRLPARDFIRTYEFMRCCCKGDFRLQHLCSFLGISKERFTRLFLASTQATPANFYNRMLLERGRKLLCDAALSIKEIGFQLGFKTTSHFIVTFRREFAASPQEYRQRLEKTAPVNGARMTWPTRTDYRPEPVPTSRDIGYVFGGK
jgi:AraC-like DNA-binding protein